MQPAAQTTLQPVAASERCTARTSRRLEHVDELERGAVTLTAATLALVRRRDERLADARDADDTRKRFEEDAMVREGEPAPDFTLTSDTGERVRLSSLRGKPVVLYFYPKDDAPPQNLK